MASASPKLRVALAIEARKTEADAACSVSSEIGCQQSRKKRPGLRVLALEPQDIADQAKQLSRTGLAQSLIPQDPERCLQTGRISHSRSRIDFSIVRLVPDLLLAGLMAESRTDRATRSASSNARCE